GALGSPPVDSYFNAGGAATPLGFFVFGRNNGGDALWRYDGPTNTWTNVSVVNEPTAPSVRSRGALVWDGTRVIVFGGYQISPAKALSDLWWYDIGLGVWTNKIADGV